MGGARLEEHTKPDVFWLFCGTTDCNYARNCARKQLHTKHTWKPIHCAQCKRHLSAARWHCSCGVTWHSCPAHRQDGFACGTSRRPPAPKEGRHNKRRRVAPLGGKQGEQWTDAITHVPIQAPSLFHDMHDPDIGSFEALVSHATEANVMHERYLPSCVHALPACLDNIAISAQACRNPLRSTQRGVIKAVRQHASKLNKQPHTPLRMQRKGSARGNSARRDAQAIASLIRDPGPSISSLQCSRDAVSVPGVTLQAESVVAQPRKALRETYSFLASRTQKEHIAFSAGSLVNTMSNRALEIFTFKGSGAPDFSTADDSQGGPCGSSIRPMGNDDDVAAVPQQGFVGDAPDFHHLTLSDSPCHQTGCLEACRLIGFQLKSTISLSSAASDASVRTLLPSNATSFDDQLHIAASAAPALSTPSSNSTSSRACNTKLNIQHTDVPVDDTTHSGHACASMHAWTTRHAAPRTRSRSPMPHHATDGAVAYQSIGSPTERTASPHLLPSTTADLAGRTGPPAHLCVLPKAAPEQDKCHAPLVASCSPALPKLAQNAQDGKFILHYENDECSRDCTTSRGVQQYSVSSAGSFSNETSHFSENSFHGVDAGNVQPPGQCSVVKSSHHAVRVSRAVFATPAVAFSAGATNTLSQESMRPQLSSTRPSSRFLAKRAEGFASVPAPKQPRTMPTTPYESSHALANYSQMQPAGLSHAAAQKALHTTIQLPQPFVLQCDSSSLSMQHSQQCNDAHQAHPASKHEIMKGPPCNGRCPKEGWKIEQFCEYCHR